MRALSRLCFCLSLVILNMAPSRLSAQQLLQIPKDPALEGGHGYNPRSIAFAVEQQSLKGGVAAALQQLNPLKAGDINRTKGLSPQVIVDPDQAGAVSYLQAVRSPEAVAPLIPFIGVHFLWVPRVDGARPIMRQLPDETLRAIGLPAADGILQAVAADKLDPASVIDARKLLVDMLGEEGLKTRVVFLKLSKNNKIQSFLEKK